VLPPAHALAAAVFEDIYPVQWTGQQAVVVLPEHIDLSSADQIREELLSVINRGAAALIVDMTATVSCDYAGADALVRAYQRAVVSGTELQLVVTAQIVRRVLGLSGIDRLVPIYPSLEASMAARAPAADAPLGGRAPHRPAVRVRGQQRAARPSNRPAAAITRAVLLKLVDALHDGVAMADSDGMLALASRRLEETFGYGHGELPGHPVERLIPPDLQAAHRRHWAAYTQAPHARFMGAGTRLVGLRKDGTTFPVEVSLSPVATATGQFTLAVIRDVTRARRQEDLTDLARAAAAAEHAPGQELLERISASLLHVGLSLHVAMDLPTDIARQHIAKALSHLDDTIREIRAAAFADRTCDITPHPG
jgi:anti-anti-sigma factor